MEKEYIIRKARMEDTNTLDAMLTELGMKPDTTAIWTLPTGYRITMPGWWKNQGVRCW